MGAASRALTAVYAAVAAVDVTLSARGTPGAARARRVTKPALMPLLGARLALDPAVRGRRGRAVAAGLAASWAGDCLLLQGHHRGFFAAGAGAFAGAHAAYLASFAPDATRGAVTPAGRRAAAAVLVTAAAAAPPVVAAAARTDRTLGVVAGAYSAVLAAMGAAAVAQIGRPGGAWTAAGGLLFVASDTALGVRTFAHGDATDTRRRALDGTVMATYTAAQYALTRCALTATATT